VKAVARVLLTYATAVPMQRWLGIATLALLPLALVPKAPVVVLPIIAAACFSCAVVLPSGWLLRALSAPSGHGLLPHFRRRVLAATLLLLAAVALSWFAFASLGPRPVSLGALIVLGWALSIVLWMVFFFIPGPGGVGSLLVVPVFLVLLFPQVLPSGLRIDSVYGAVALVALWVGFSLWYLRVPTIGAAIEWRGSSTAGLPTGLQALDAAVASRRGEFTRDSAVRAYLTGRYPTSALRQIVWLLLVVPIFVGVIAFCFRKNVMHPGLLCVFASTLVIGSNRTARRARMLWLLRGSSRRELYSVAERGVWRVAIVGFPTMIALQVWLQIVVLHAPLQLLGLSLALWFAGSVLGIYLGLAFVRGFTPVAIALALALPVSLAIGFWALLEAPTRYDVLFAIVALQLGGALVARTVGAWRWSGIDWRTLRVIRVTGAGLARSR
jgi:hypothetical protein